MSSSRHSLRAQIAAQARHRCGYCLTQEVVSGIPLTLEHIIPKALGGALALAPLGRLITRENADSYRPWSERVPYIPLREGLE